MKKKQKKINKRIFHRIIGLNDYRGQKSHNRPFVNWRMG